MTSETEDAPILLIDGECMLCNRIARFVIRRDPGARFRFAALQSKRAEVLLRERGLPPPPPGTFVMIDRGQAFYRSDAALRLLGELPFPWRLARLARLVPRALRDWGYDLVARTRIRLFGRTTVCALLTPTERKRFLLDEDFRP